MTVSSAKAATIGPSNLTISESSATVVCTGCISVIAAPTLSAISPANVVQGSTTAVTVMGTGFAPGAGLTGPKGVTFTNIKVVSSTKITATMTVATTTLPGTDLAITVKNKSTAGYGKATAKLLTVSTPAAIRRLGNWFLQRLAAD
jgi:hypothetical protein